MSHADRNLTPQEVEVELGEQLKILRIHQIWIKPRCRNVQVSAYVHCAISKWQRFIIAPPRWVLRALGREQWLETIASVPSINPLVLTREAKPRQRTSKPRNPLPGK